ncbi:MAG: redoxin domain-containing protein, partial [Flavobacteriaceae bacterium]
LVGLLMTMPIMAQHTISGTFEPAGDYTWLIIYRLKPGTQVYVADTAIKEGRFTLTLPENAEEGTYRVVYAIPQEEFYFDVLFNGKESIELSFHGEKGLTFLTSPENQTFTSYFGNIHAVEQELIGYYTQGRTDTTQYMEILKRLAQTQRDFERASEGMMAHTFIKANAPYIPEEYESVEKYVIQKKTHYFDSLTLNSKTLQASGFLTDKLTNYVFTALPIHPMAQEETEQAMNQNVDTVVQKLSDAGIGYKGHVYYTLWSQAAASGFNDTSDYIYGSFLKKWAQETQNMQIINQVETHNRLRIGATAPDILWEGGSLAELESAGHYVVVFWSSTCPHCISELPKLQGELVHFPHVKVLAIGLEEEEDLENWKRQKAKLTHFEHGMALGKWESETAQTYVIQSTPSYFVLGPEKKILAKPGDYKALIKFLKE